MLPKGNRTSPPLIVPFILTERRTVYFHRKSIFFSIEFQKKVPGRILNQEVGIFRRITLRNIFEIFCETFYTMTFIES